MTQQELADAAGVDLKTIYNLESGTRWPIAKTRASVSAALQWGPDALSALSAGTPPGEVRGRDSAGQAHRPARRDVADDPKLAPYIRGVRAQLASAMAEYGPHFTGAQAFPEEHEAETWDDPGRRAPDPDVRVYMIATFRKMADEYETRGRRSGLTLAGHRI